MVCSVDLHLHARVSGGQWEILPLVRRLKELSVDVASVTDHNTVENVPAFADAATLQGIVPVSGVELDVGFNGAWWHLLLYGMCPEDPELLRLLDGAVTCNRERACATWRCVEEHGYHLPSLEARTDLREMLDVAIALAEDGHVSRAWEGYRLIVRLNPVLPDLYPLKDAIQRGHRAGALAVLAHPGRGSGGLYGRATADDLDVMTPLGLDGVEAHYHEHTAEQRAEFVAWAEDRGLVVTCGSDSHAPGNPWDPTPWPAGLCAKFLDRLGIVV